MIKLRMQRRAGKGRLVVEMLWRHPEPVYSTEVPMKAPPASKHEYNRIRTVQIGRTS